jgi:hydrazine synthase alpha subunit-like protein
MSLPMNIIRIAIYAGLASVISVSCSSNKYEGKIVAVELQGDKLNNLNGARLLLLDPEKAEKPATDLLSGFESSASPNLSHEGCYLYFQGKQNEGDPWQIWVMDLNKGSVNQVIDLPENCTQPASLPDGNIVFSREGKVKGKEVRNLWKCMMDGCCLTQLTHNPTEDQYPNVLWEGRILYSSQQVYPETRKAQLMIMRPDGTKSELYSPGGYGMLPVSGGLDSPDGYIYFVSTDGQLSRVLHRRPLHTFVNLSANLSGSFASVTPTADSTCLVSFLPLDGDSYGLYRFNPLKPETLVALFPEEKNLVDPLLIARVDPRPKILPSPVDPAKPTALLMTQDINHSMLPVNEGITGDSLANRIRIFTLEGELAVVEAKDDGSVYIKLDADTPFYIETLNSQGEIVRGPSDWIYLRPNERRACTGCHANPELAPRNYQPHAILEDPVLLATQVKKTSH